MPYKYNVFTKKLDYYTTVSGGGGVTDHGALAGLTDDDHTQYLLRTDFTTSSGDILTYVSDNYVDNTEMTTISGDLVSGYVAADSTLSGILSAEIDSDVSTLSGVLTAEIDSDISTLSGVLTAEIDSDIATFSGTIDHDTIINNHNLTTDIDHDALTNYAVGQHRTINDSGSAATDLWSAEKISLEITTISGKLDDHDELNNLDYASAGHTGFQPAGDYVTDAEMTTISGDLVSGYTAADSTLSGVLTAEIDSDISTLSGVLTAEIDSDIATFSGTIDHDTIINNHNLTTDIDHDALTNYAVGQHRTINDSGSAATDLWSAEKISLEITTISGKLDDHDELNNLDYASAGHTGFQPAGDYVTDAEMTTVSGDILVVAAADVDSDITTHISADDHTQYLRTDGTRALTGTWNYGSDTISGTGDIYAADFFGGKIIETIKSHGVVSSGTEIFDLNEGTYHITTISGNFTAAFSGWSSTGVTSMTMKLTNAGAHTITWDAAVKWEGGIEPFWTNSGTDFGVFFSDNNGTDIYGIRSATDMG